MKPNWLRYEPFKHLEEGYSEMVENAAVQAYFAPDPVREWPIGARVDVGCYQPEELFPGVVVSAGWYPDTYAVLLEPRFWRWLYPHSEISRMRKPTVHPWIPASNLSFRELIVGLDRVLVFD